ncbi:hypothetical protein O7605_29290 [Verrucosispora sp. WMMA2121]|uniref:hypothetical protein n=1 Tax=Verrucosispora sp. WMMA2121 TaxID=3015164 RepID=UPI0022B65527|nr:hypothetical protein [Verrucosispora sp. WMMA2121]MCZ7423608.1 hypothetical protein [Verrucosispora sp. WMMA2121]
MVEPHMLRRALGRELVPDSPRPFVLDVYDVKLMAVLVSLCASVQTNGQIAVVRDLVRPYVGEYVTVVAGDHPSGTRIEGDGTEVSGR